MDFLLSCIDGLCFETGDLILFNSSCIVGHGFPYGTLQLLLIITGSAEKHQQRCFVVWNSGFLNLQTCRLIVSSGDLFRL